jgi:hypothetical protein
LRLILELINFTLTVKQPPFANDILFFGYFTASYLKSLKFDFVNCSTDLIRARDLISLVFYINATVISCESIFTIESIIKKNRLVLSLRGFKKVKETSFYKS